jgi:autophagy-related protein 101
VELETLIDSRVTTLIQQLSSTNTRNGGIRGQIAVQFFEKRRRKSGLWFGGLGGKGEEEICWEIWSVEVTLATPKTEAGKFHIKAQDFGRSFGRTMAELS